MPRPTPRLLAAVAVLLGGAVLGPAPADAGSATVDVRMGDDFFNPSTVFVPQGQGVEFDNFGLVGHDAMDGSGLELFETGYLDPGEEAVTDPLPGAGTYRYYCTFHSQMRGRIDVPVRLSRNQAPKGSEVTVRWAVTRGTEERVFDVQRRRPGAARFVPWRSGVTATAAIFRPADRGRWELRARVRQVGVDASDWSPVRVLTVT